MGPLKAIVKKEMRLLLRSPLAYAMAAIFSALCGWHFTLLLGSLPHHIPPQLEVSLNLALFDQIHILLLFFCPLLAMGQFAQEEREGTLDLLLLGPIQSWTIILGKFFGVWFLSLILLGLTTIYPLALDLIGHSMWGTYGSAFFGTGLMSGFYILIGLFASTLTRHQFLAAVISYGFIFSGLLILISSQVIENPLLSQILAYLGPGPHYRTFLTGVIRSYDLIFFLSCFTLLFYGTHRSLQRRFWS